MTRRDVLALCDHTGRLDPFVVSTAILVVFGALVATGVIVVTY